MIREEIEKREKSWLGPHAMLAVNSWGRIKSEPPDPIRTCFMVDRDRVVHSKSFRRLKHKTQVFIAPRGDHYRSRLTHTLEVNQIAKTIGAGLNLNIDLIEAMALAHDVGHTPFAHAGEEILNQLLPGGFRHNENSIRVLTRVEQHRRGPGLNLSREVLDGVLHHSGYGGQAHLASTAEGRVIRLSDKIAYVQHDIDDSIRGGLLSLQDLPRQFIDVLGSSHSQRIATLVIDTIEYSLSRLKPGEVPLIEPSPPVEEALRGLRQFMFGAIYNGSVCLAERKRAGFVIEHLYSYFLKNPLRMTPLYLEIAEQEGLERAVADYIAGMSDEYCIGIFENVYVPRSLVPDQFKIFSGEDIVDSL